MEKSSAGKVNTVYFLTGCLLGILCFVSVYGIKILNVTYDGWLMNADVDLIQHYTGFGHYRNSAWTFPFGLISTLSYPFSMSIVYTDSIPIVSVFFKLLSPILPKTFQFFGIYGLVSFMLMGGFSMLLIHRFVENRVITVVYTMFFILSFPILQRLYYHSALASQWLIIAALVIWVYSDSFSFARKIMYWGLMGFLCVGIHSYFLPMIGGVMLFSIIDECITSYKRTGSIRLEIYEGITEILAFCVLGILNLWMLGGFYGGTSASGGGIGTFESNLNSFINPLGTGISGISFPTYGDFQYEGYAYIGLGVLALVLISIVSVFVKIIKNKINPVSYFKIHHRQFLFVVLFALFILLASGPIYTMGSVVLLKIPLPGPFRDFADIFRSNGRFIWVSLYVLMIGTAVLIDKIFGKKVKTVIFVMAFILQVIDLSPEIAKKQEYFNTDKTYVSLFENPEVSQIIHDKQEFIIMNSEMYFMMDCAYYAFKHDMRTSTFYYARNIDDKIDDKRNEYEQELLIGNSSDSAVYIFKKEDMPAAKYPDLLCYELGSHVIGVKR